MIWFELNIKRAFTVGFIRKLPHHLVQAFTSTLTETAEADVLIYVIDASNPQYQTHIKVVDSVLSDIGAGGKPTVYVYNKVDLIEDALGFSCDEKNSVGISAKSGENIEKLIDLISETAPGKKREITVLIPYSYGALVSELHKNQKILSEEFLAEGTKLTLLADKITYAKLKDYTL